MSADLRSEIRTVLNRHSAENGSNAPDFILADYLLDCLRAFDHASQARAASQKTVRGPHPPFLLLDEIAAWGEVPTPAATDRTPA